MANELLFRKTGGGGGGSSSGGLASVWSGYHAADSSWSVAGTSIIDPTGDASSTFTERVNVNAGTVTSALSSGNKIPGIIFTPVATGTYQVTVTFTATQANANSISYFALTDGSTEICNTQFIAGGANIPSFCVTMNGLYVVSSISAKTIKIQMGNSAGGTTSIGGGATVNGLVEWTLTKVT